jgi:ectoine hydroxylase-related dioxygenase (phytanoyl-CoA dioxygenase family)
LVASGVPPLFAYVYDAFWTPGARLLPLLAPTLEVPELLDDVWAWLLPATAGARGWAPHRGNSVLERRDDGRPLMLNVWIALTDTDADHACMHLVPKTKDPDYPHALRQSTGVAQGVPVPLRAGSALLWDANVLHWGGTMSPDARRPRASFSYTVRAADAPPLVPPQRTTASHEERLGTIARQILRYEPQAKELGALVRQWAAITHGMAAVAKNKP